MLPMLWLVMLHVCGKINHPHWKSLILIDCWPFSFLSSSLLLKMDSAGEDSRFQSEPRLCPFASFIHTCCPLLCTSCKLDLHQSSKTWWFSFFSFFIPALFNKWNRPVQKQDRNNGACLFVLHHEMVQFFNFIELHMLLSTLQVKKSPAGLYLQVTDHRLLNVWRPTLMKNMFWVFLTCSCGIILMMEDIYK